MMKRLVLVAAALFTLMISCNAATAADGPPDMPTALVGFGAEYASDGQGSDLTESIYVPLVFTWFPTERIDTGIELPIISLRGSNTSVHLYENTRNATSSMMGRSGGAGSSGVTTGLGDILLRFGAIAGFETERLPQLRSSLYVKVPTASKSEGLGTGEFDAGAGVDAIKWFGDLQLTGEAFYHYQGKAPDFGLLDYFSYTAGIGWQVSNTLRPMVLVKGATPPSRASGDLLEARIRLLWALTPAASLDLFFSRGIAASSPDYGGGIAVLYSY